MDWTNPIGSAISGGFGLIGSAVNYAFNKRLAEQQNAYNLQMWNLNNEYNSPTNQMRRYEEAGLNPSLLYGQISSGNASHAPEAVTPSSPDFSRDMRELSQAFNIEGLRTAIANRKKAQEEARISKAQADAAEGENRYFEDLGWNFKLSPNGQLVRKDPSDTFNIRPTSGMIAEGRILQALSDNFRTNSLLVPRANLIGTQAQLNKQRNALYAPQIRYWNFQTEPWRMKTNFWLAPVRTGAQVLNAF